MPLQVILTFTQFLELNQKYWINKMIEKFGIKVYINKVKVKFT